MLGPSSSPRTAILDTNVVLDWLVFRNPDLAAVGSAIVTGDLRWIATRAMREELTHVLARGHLDRWSPDLPALWADWDRWCHEVDAPPPLAPPGRWRCSDPDDQKFIDLAVATRAHWLLSRDRAVLKLARRLRDLGVRVAPPQDWTAPLDP